MTAPSLLYPVLLSEAASLQYHAPQTPLSAKMCPVPQATFVLRVQAPRYRVPQVTFPLTAVPRRSQRVRFASAVSTMDTTAQVALSENAEKIRIIFNQVAPEAHNGVLLGAIATDKI